MLKMNVSMFTDNLNIPCEQCCRNDDVYIVSAKLPHTPLKNIQMRLESFAAAPPLVRVRVTSADVPSPTNKTLPSLPSARSKRSFTVVPSSLLRKTDAAGFVDVVAQKR